MEEEFLVDTTFSIVDRGLPDKMINKEEANNPKTELAFEIVAPERQRKVHKQKEAVTPVITTVCVMRSCRLSTSKGNSATT
mmetsp:Transcript_8143/g.10674  ORF Transcript_8143/g.10674 Transcript_8143/m.10674 type:complete len:81 (-) Transcript_8143:381-623(-)